MAGSVEKVAIVTGASSGIGKASALALADAGYAVVLAARREAALKEIVATIEAKGGKALAVACNVGDPKDVEALFAKTKAAFGRLDVLFNNAGTSATSSMEDLSYEQWKNVVDVNLSGTFMCTREAFRIMKDQKPMGGRIINNGSISAHTPRPNAIAYNATKHGITGITKSASLDGRQYDIACSQIDIGNALTDRTERMTKGILQPNGMTAIEPVMDVEYVAKAVVHMAELPLDVNVQFMTIMATKMPFIGRG